MSPDPSPTRRPRIFNLLWIVTLIAVAVLGRVGWNALKRAPAPVAAGVAIGTEGEHAMKWVALGDAEAAAKQSGKPILYDFNAAWCPPCRALAADVFSDPARARTVMAHVVPVTVVDRYREDGHNAPDVDALQQRFQVEALPTLVVLSPATGRFEKTEGYGGPEETLRWIAQASASVSSGTH